MKKLGRTMMIMMLMLTSACSRHNEWDDVYSNVSTGSSDMIAD